MEKKPTNNIRQTILSDTPAEQLFSEFYFENYIQALHDRLVHKENRTPFVISIEGDWGSGKTTLMRHLKNKLEEAAIENKNKGDQRTCHTVWFQAWKYNEQDEILSALIQEIINSMKKENFLKGSIASFFQNKIINIIINSIAKSIKIYGLTPVGDMEESQHKKKLAYYYHFQYLLKILINLYTSRISKKQFIKTFRKVTKRFSPLSDDYNKKDRYDDILLIFIDDLDRCSDEKIIKILESIKLFLDFPGCAIVMGISPSIISSAVEEVTKDPPLQYLEKIIQVKFPLPAFRKDQFKKYLEEIIKKTKLLERYNIPYDKITDILSSCSDTPRQCKQFLNNLTLLFEILDKRDVIKKEINLKLTDEIIEFQRENRYIYKLLILADEPSLINIQNFLKNRKSENVEDDYYLIKFRAFCELNLSILDKLDPIFQTTKFDKDTIRETIAYFHFLAFYLIKEKINRCFQDKKSKSNSNSFPTISEYLKDVNFWRDLQKGFITENLISSELHKEIFTSLKNQIKDLHSLILELPADEINLQLLIYHGLEATPSKVHPLEYYEQTVLIEDKFSIDKFPVTNKRFIKFLMEIKQEKNSEIDNYILFPYSKINITEKDYTTISEYENHPVTGVTWKGAVAFAKYYYKSLPTIKQWEKAFGDNNYPYGDSFDGNKCNTVESNQMNTTPVDQYSNGVSQKGVYDMAGNVWEWCDDKVKGTDQRIIKGGSWANRKEDAQRTNQASFPENRGMANIGFRCVSKIS